MLIPHCYRNGNELHVKKMKNRRAKIIVFLFVSLFFSPILSTQVNRLSGLLGCANKLKNVSLVFLSNNTHFLCNLILGCKLKQSALSDFVRPRYLGRSLVGFCFHDDSRVSSNKLSTTVTFLEILHNFEDFLVMCAAVTGYASL